MDQEEVYNHFFSFAVVSIVKIWPLLPCLNFTWVKKQMLNEPCCLSISHEILFLSSMLKRATINTTAHIHILSSIQYIQHLYIQIVASDRTQERVIFVVCSLSSRRRPKSSLSMRLLNSIVYLEFFRSLPRGSVWKKLCILSRFFHVSVKNNRARRLHKQTSMSALFRRLPRGRFWSLLDQMKITVKRIFLSWLWFYFGKEKEMLGEGKIEWKGSIKC